MLRPSRLSSFVAALVLTWLCTLWFGAWGPFAAGVLSGRFAPRRGGFLYPALGGLAAWLLWFMLSALTAPIVPLAKLLGAIAGIGATGGLALPFIASILCAVVVGIASLGGTALFSAFHPPVGVTQRSI